jgi:hypothetical protein
MRGTEREYEDEMTADNLFVFPGKTIEDLTNTDILRFASEGGISRLNSTRDTITAVDLSIDQGHFVYTSGWRNEYMLRLLQTKKELSISCTCGEAGRLLCVHQAALLVEVMEMRALRVWFDKSLRNSLMLEHAREYGLENEADLSEFFDLSLVNGRLTVKPSNPSILALGDGSRRKLEEQLMPRQDLPSLPVEIRTEKIVLIGNSLYGGELYLRLFEAPVTKQNTLKNPVTPAEPAELILDTNDAHGLKFFSGFARFRNDYRNLSSREIDDEVVRADLKSIKAILLNPYKYRFFEHDTKVSETIKAASLRQVDVEQSPVDMELTVSQKGSFYEIEGFVEMLNKRIPFDSLDWPYRYFLRRGPRLVLLENAAFIRVLQFFRQNHNRLILHESKFEAFRSEYLTRLESGIRVNYTFVKKAAAPVIESAEINKMNEKLIVLSESDDWVLITPAVRYGEYEVPVRSRRQLYAIDQLGNHYEIARDETAEEQLRLNVCRLHPDFEMQEAHFDFYYLPKKDFFDSLWFLDAFEYWNRLGYTVLGFSEISRERLNPNRVKVTRSIASGIDWFDTQLEISFGEQTADLKSIRKAVMNRSKYVQLGDGTQGILPEEWLEKLGNYLRNAEISGDTVRVHKLNYQAVEDFFRDEVLSADVARDIAKYRAQFESFDQIAEVSVPKALKAQLRPYQREGLNWLCFLDDFGIGGCLADDMGLGKTVQVIAFLLHRRGRNPEQTDLIVVPKSLIFNWQQEIEKFAPKLKVHTVHGTSRVKTTKEFSKYDVILTTYGTLMSDIAQMKKFSFDYVILDESQAIKNPASARYKAVRLLHSRNRLTLTGTPVENNTFDLFAQMSFLNPMLFGSEKRFRDDYAMPIDKFKDIARAKELQRRVHPFLLRRTKRQVATELPEKTEMVIFCEMGAEQRRLYDTYKEELKERIKEANAARPGSGNMLLLQGFTKLRQICNSPGLLSDEEFYGDSSAKIEELMAQIEAKSTAHKILIFSQFVGMLELIAGNLRKENIDYAMLTGSTENRQEVVERFQSEKGPRVFLISLKAGGTGLNLTEADYVYVVDPWWNPAAENQAIDRAYRIGQTKHVMAIRLITPNSIEEKILGLQQTKRELVEDLIHTDLSAMKQLTAKELQALLD